MPTPTPILRPALAAARAAAGLTAYRLSQISGVSQTQIGMFERGEKMLREDSLDRLIAAIGPGHVAREIRRLTA